MKQSAWAFLLPGPAATVYQKKVSCSLTQRMKMHFTELKRGNILLLLFLVDLLLTGVF